MSKWKNIGSNKWLRIFPALLVLVLSISFVQKKQQAKVCQQVFIDIEDQYDNYYLTEEDVRVLLTAKGRDKLIGTDMSAINLRELERRVEENLFVRKADAYKDLKGNIIVNVKQRRPMARFSRGGDDFYLTNDALIVPISSRYSSRVPIISGTFSRKIKPGDFMQNEHGKAIFELLNYINASEFWRAQISELDIDSKGKITLYPQVGKQRIEFGKAEGIEEKFNKLLLFYEQILPRKGWNAYSRVSVQFEGQIVCE